MRMLLIFLLSASVLVLKAQSGSTPYIDSLRKAIDTASIEDRKKGMALVDLAAAHMHRSEHTVAAKAYAEAVSLSLRIKDTLLEAFVYRQLATLCFNEGDYRKALSYLDKASLLYNRLHDIRRVKELLKSRGDNFLMLKDSAKAKKFYEQAVEHYRNTKQDLSLAMTYANLALMIDTVDASIEMLQAASAIFDTIPTDNPIPANVLGNIGVAYLGLVRYNRFGLLRKHSTIPRDEQTLLKLSEDYLRRSIALSDEKGNVAGSAYSTGVLAELQAYRKDYKNAYNNIRKYYETNDSIYSQENKNQIASLQSKQEIDLKNAEIENRELELSNQRTRLLLLVAVVILLAAVGILFYLQSRHRKRNNETLTALNTKLAAANEVKARFFAILSHDLRSPIANLVSFLQLQEKKPGLLNESQIRDREQKISQSAQSLLETMEGMLLWSKRQMEIFKPVMNTVEIHSLFGHVWQFFQGYEHISIRFTGGEGMLLTTDENYLRTIMQNLTANAVKAVTNSANPLLSWTATENDKHIILTLLDNGLGISEDQVLKMMENGGQKDSRHGFGLYIIRDLANAINCTMRWRRPEEGGTEVALLLPKKG